VEVAIVGTDGAARDALVDVLRTRLLPATVQVTAAPGVGTDLTPLLANRGDQDEPVAYVCQRFACRLPVSAPEALREQLDELQAFA
jgi:uncharacterized protein YyaL (SSP411 family)